MHDVVVTGQVAADEDPNAVALRLAELTKVSTEQAAELLKKPVVIKRDVDESTARRYQAALSKIGVRCEIRPKEPISLDLDLPQPAAIPPPIPRPPPVTPPLAAPPTPPTDHSSEASPGGTFGALASCPGCGGQVHAQAAACPHCGTQQKRPVGAVAEPVAPGNEVPKLTRKQIFIAAYLAIAAVFTIWNTFFGNENYRGFFFNLGKSLVWPFQVFPFLGKIVGGILLLAFIVYFVILDPKPERPRDGER